MGLGLEHFLFLFQRLSLEHFFVFFIQLGLEQLLLFLFFQLWLQEFFFLFFYLGLEHFLFFFQGLSLQLLLLFPGLALEGGRSILRGLLGVLFTTDHLFGHSIGLLFVPVARCTDLQLALDPGGAAEKGWPLGVKERPRLGGVLA